MREIQLGKLKEGDNWKLGDDDYIEIVVKTNVLEGDPITPREQQHTVPAHSTANERRGV